MMRKLSQKYVDGIIVSIIFLLILLFILDYIPLSSLFTDTITAGGDTPSHYYPAKYLADYLIPQFKIIGWAQGWFAGIPLFQFYFPLSFVAIAALGTLVPLQVAFKIVILLAIIAIPFGAYVLLRLMRFSKSISVIGAIFTLPFLFMEANSMWGGNIPSTFAGEFSYALGLAMSLAYLGLMYRGIETRNHLLKSALLLAAIGFAHVYTLLWVVTTSLFLLISRDFKKRFIYWFKVNTLAFLLLGFWIIPMIYYLGYTSPYALKWIFGSWKDFFPVILWPFAVLVLIGIVRGVAWKDKRFQYLFFAAAIPVLFYFSAFKLGLADIRFIPLIQLALLMVAVSPFVLIYKTRLRGLRFIPFIVFLIIVLLVQANTSFISEWAEWNYKGMEEKKLWGPYSDVNAFLKGDESDPRVVYEHSMDHNAAGTTRAYELLPVYAGRSTLEGSYLQSSPSSPFIFYIQSEVSKAGSCPYIHRKCGSFDLDAAAKHLRIFNVKHFVAITEKVKSALSNHSEYELVFEKKPYEVYELKGGDTGYVTVPRYKPVLFPKTDWQNRSYELFIENTEVPVVFDAAVSEEPAITKERINRNCTVTSEVRQEEVLFNTNCVGLPHIIKISYFPRWKSDNGEKIHLVSPSFMLIYPEKEQTRLYFGRTWVENTSLLLSVIGWILVFGYGFIPTRKSSSGTKKQTKRVRRRNKR